MTRATCWDRLVVRHADALWVLVGLAMFAIFCVFLILRVTGHL